MIYACRPVQYHILQDDQAKAVSRIYFVSRAITRNITNTVCTNSRGLSDKRNLFFIACFLLNFTRPVFSIFNLIGKSPALKSRI